MSTSFIHAMMSPEKDADFPRSETPCSLQGQKPGKGVSSIDLYISVKRDYFLDKKFAVELFAFYKL
ncbi:MAG: hypothetical protein ACLFPD_09750 [Desulfosudaceae bacterium]